MNDLNAADALPMYVGEPEDDRIGLRKHVGLAPRFAHIEGAGLDPFHLYGSPHDRLGERLRPPALRVVHDDDARAHWNRSRIHGDEHVHEPLDVGGLLLAEVRLEVVPCALDPRERLVLRRTRIEDGAHVPVEVDLAIARRVHDEQRLVDPRGIRDQVGVRREARPRRQPRARRTDVSEAHACRFIRSGRSLRSDPYSRVAPSGSASSDGSVYAGFAIVRWTIITGS